MADLHDSTLIKNLEAITSHTHYSKRSLAVAAGVGETYISVLIRNPERAANLDKVKAIARELNIDFGILLDDANFSKHLTEGGDIASYTGNNTQLSSPTTLAPKNIIHAAFALTRNVIKSHQLELSDDEQDVLASQICVEMQELGTTKLDDQLIKSIIRQIPDLVQSHKASIAK